MNSNTLNLYVPLATENILTSLEMHLRSEHFYEIIVQIQIHNFPSHFVHGIIIGIVGPDINCLDLT